MTRIKKIPSLPLQSSKLVLKQTTPHNISDLQEFQDTLSHNQKFSTNLLMAALASALRALEIETGYDSLWIYWGIRKKIGSLLTTEDNNIQIGYIAESIIEYGASANSVYTLLSSWFLYSQIKIKHAHLDYKAVAQKLDPDIFFRLFANGTPQYEPRNKQGLSLLNCAEKLKINQKSKKLLIKAIKDFELQDLNQGELILSLKSKAS